MKKFLVLTLVLALSSITMFAQKSKTSANTPKNTSIVVRVPKDLNLQDKVILSNESPYQIIQATVSYYNSKGKLVKLGTIHNLDSDEKTTVYEYRDNALKNLCGKKLVVSAKGKKGKNSSTTNFVVELDDHRHDLIIKLKAK